jgi:hypothetical protein
MQFEDQREIVRGLALAKSVPPAAELDPPRLCNGLDCSLRHQVVVEPDDGIGPT